MPLDFRADHLNARPWPCIPAANHLVAHWRHILVARQVHLIAQLSTIQLRSKGRQWKDVKNVMPAQLHRSRQKERKKERKKATKWGDLVFSCSFNQGAKRGCNCTHEEKHEHDMKRHRHTDRRPNLGCCSLRVITYVRRHSTCSMLHKHSSAKLRLEKMAPTFSWPNFTCVVRTSKLPIW